MTSNTSKTYSPPKSDDWHEIGKFNHFPILPKTRYAFHQLMLKASLNFDSLAKVAEQDPAICLHLLLHIQNRTPENLGKINTAAGCIALLGMEDVVRLVKGLPVLDEQPNNRSELNYRNALNNAVLAGRIAAQWSQFKPGLNSHQAQWAAMLASAPLWAWHLQQVSASQHYLNQMSQGQDIIPALQSGFGALSIEGLSAWQNLAHQLALPDICQSLWQANRWPNREQWQALRKQPLTYIEGQRELKLKCQQPELLIFFANALATQYSMGAYRCKSRRWLQLSAHYLNKDPNHIHQEILTLSLQLAKQGHLTTAVHGLLAPAHSSLPVRPVYQCIRPLSELKMERMQPLEAVTQESIAATSVVERTMDQASVKALIMQLQQSPESFGDWHQLMHSVLKSIVEGIGLKRAYTMVQNKQRTAAKIYYQQGLPESDPLCSLVISLESNSVFKKMLEKPASLMINANNREKMLRGLSPAEKNMFPQQFMMMSLFSNDRPVGIVFADIGKSELTGTIEPVEYKAFKSLCLAASASLGKLADMRLAKE